MRAAWSLAIAVLLCGCSSSPKHAENSEIPASVEYTRSISCEFRNNSGEFRRGGGQRVGPERRGAIPQTRA